MGDLLLLPIKFHINESYMENILYFVEVVNIAGVHIKMDTSKGKLIYVLIEEVKIVHFKACAEGLFYTNLNGITMITNPTNISLYAYLYLSTVKQKSDFLKLVPKLKEHRKFESYSNNFTGQ